MLHDAAIHTLMLLIHHGVAFACTSQANGARSCLQGDRTSDVQDLKSFGVVPGVTDLKFLGAYRGQPGHSNGSRKTQGESSLLADLPGHRQ